MERELPEGAVCCSIGCEEPATIVRWNAPFCEIHRCYHSNKMSWVADARVYKAFEEGLERTWYAGWTYIFELPNGKLKIGMTANKSAKLGVLDRADEVGRRHKGLVNCLAIFTGGQNLESYLHYKFAGLRDLYVLGEEFEDSPAIREICKKGRNADTRNPAIKNLGIQLATMREVNELIPLSPRERRGIPDGSKVQWPPRPGSWRG